MAHEAHSATLYRLDDAVVGGVCAGIAERLDLDPLVVRILAVLVTAVTAGLGIVAYVVAWVLLPQRHARRTPYDVIPESAESRSSGSLDCHGVASADAAGEGALGAPGASGAGRGQGVSLAVRLAVVVGLTLLFMAVAMGIPPLMEGIHWWQFWPTALLILGVCLVVVPIRTRHEMAWHVAGVVMASLAAAVFPMVLGMLSWATVPAALSSLWFLPVAAVVLFVLGERKGKPLLLVAGGACVVALCVCTVVFFGVPGTLESLMLVLPDGRVFIMQGPLSL